MTYWEVEEKLLKIDNKPEWDGADNRSYFKLYRIDRGLQVIHESSGVTRVFHTHNPRKPQEELSEYTDYSILDIFLMKTILIIRCKDRTIYYFKNGLSSYEKSEDVK